MRKVDFLVASLMFIVMVMFGCASGDKDEPMGESSLEGLVINEVVAKDTSGSEDWFELYVTGSEPVRLSDFYVVDDKGHVSFRQVRLGEPAGEGLIEVLAGVTAGEKVALEPVKAGMLSASSKSSGT